MRTFDIIFTEEDKRSYQLCMEGTAVENGLPYGLVLFHVTLEGELSIYISVDDHKCEKDFLRFEISADTYKDELIPNSDFFTRVKTNVLKENMDAFLFGEHHFVTPFGERIVINIKKES